MGYTHYWTITEPIPPDTLEAWSHDVRMIALASEVPLAGYDGTGMPDYTNGVSLNGLGPDDDHETFLIDGTPGWTFCKTAAKPYDVIVTASLLALKGRIGDGILLTSDGEYEDWLPGHALAERALHRLLPTFRQERED